MRRIRLVIAYDGTGYVGWQRQPNGLSIEEVLTKELRKVLKEDVTLIGASRTDSGVHALGNVAVFDTDARMPAEKIAIALNTGLPDDIAVQSSAEVPPDWHPRRINSRKTYEYRILNRAVPLPAERFTSWFYHHPLDVGAMREAASCLPGEHDFKSFCSIHTDVEDTVRTIYSAEIRKDGDMVVFRVTGNGFLYNMVRIIAGSLVQVGCGLKTAKWFREALEARDRAKAGPMAPARGLTLISIEEDRELPDVQDEDNPHWSYRIDYTRLKAGKRNGIPLPPGEQGAVPDSLEEQKPASCAAGEQKSVSSASEKEESTPFSGQKRESGLLPEMGPRTPVFIRIRRCADPEDWEPLLIRLCKRAVRNGAGLVLVEDRTGRLAEGMDASYFHFDRLPEDLRPLAERFACREASGEIPPEHRASDEAQDAHRAPGEPAAGQRASDETPAMRRAPGVTVTSAGPAADPVRARFLGQIFVTRDRKSR